MCSGGEPAHIGADLRQDDLGAQFTDPWDSTQLFDSVPKAGKFGIGLPVDLSNGGERVDLRATKLPMLSEFLNPGPNRNLFRSKSEAQPPVAQNEAPVEPSAPQMKSATSKPKTVAAASRGKLRSRQPTTKTVSEVPKPSPKRQASAEPESPPEGPTPPLLSGAAPTLPTGSFDNRVGSWRSARGRTHRDGKTECDREIAGDRVVHWVLQCGASQTKAAERIGRRALYVQDARRVVRLALSTIVPQLLNRLVIFSAYGLGCALFIGDLLHG